MTELAFIEEIVASAMIVIGATFALIGSWGLVRLPSLMERLHGPTKATTLGLGGILVGSVLFFQFYRGHWSAHELLISLFLFITAPISANMMAKAHLHALKVSGGMEDEPAGPLPKPPGGADWATYETPHPDAPTRTSEQ